MLASGDVYSDEDLRQYRLQVQEHEESLKQKLAHLKSEAVELAKHKQEFQVAKVKAAAINDPAVDVAVQQTEKELEKRESALMERHQEILTHGKATLELKQDLARQQVKAHLQSTDLEEFKQKYEQAKEDAQKLLAEKEAEYKKQMEEASAKIKEAQDKVQADIKARQEELLAGIEKLQKQQQAELKDNQNNKL
jgi:DNA repair exonuclease SbcCD ATPase subunit